jgi:hypothetical protein
MIHTYTFAGMTLQIIHENDQLFREINDELQSYIGDDGSKPDYDVILYHDGNEFQPPVGAIRAGYSEGKAVYIHGNSSYIWKKDSFLIKIDYIKRVIEARYHGYEEQLHLQLRSLIKWYFFIRGSEGRGLTYIHAAAAHYNDLNILFCGDSHCGKSSSLLRLVKNGARVVADDAVIIDGNRLIPFFLKTTVDADFAHRFSISGDALNTGHYVVTEIPVTGIDMIFFLHIWHNEVTLIKELEYHRALLNLMRMYRIEAQFNLLSDREKESPDMYRKVFDRYATLLKNTACLEVYAGYDEGEVENTLIGFINGHKHNNPDL